MVDSAIVGALQKQGQTNIFIRTHVELDLTNQAEVQQFFVQKKLPHLYHAAAKAKSKLGWMSITVRQMCAEMVAADLEEARKQSLLKNMGFSQLRALRS